MKLAYDFHIHTALSPCGDEAMTPNNIVNMALLNELDAIGIADHHSCRNVEPVMQAAEGTGLLVIPGMEVETAEEIHMLCLFSSLEAVRAMGRIVDDHRPSRSGSARIFGEQLIMDKDDEVVGREERLLALATTMTLEAVVEKARSLGGVAIPAHIDRPSNSLIANLGFIPPGLDIYTLEISQYASYEDYVKKYPDFLVTQSSDAHDLGYIGICGRSLETHGHTAAAVVEVLRNGGV